ncbi:hypothetical protein G6F22_011077 [Rhizopus arrhizus]|nr:hypothetical protein G6F22_011077 [Rhizopus arrhizus]
MRYRANDRGGRLRLEDIRIAGVGRPLRRQRIDQPHHGRELRAGLGGTDIVPRRGLRGVAAFKPTETPARHQRQVFRQAAAQLRIDAFLHMRFVARRALRIRKAVRLGHMRIGVEHVQRQIVGRVLDAILRRQPRHTHAHRQVLRHAQHREAAVHIRIKTDVLRRLVVIPGIAHRPHQGHRVHRARRVQRRGQTRLLHVGSRHVHAPIAVEAMRQVCKHLRLVPIPLVPVRAQKGRPLQHQRTAIAITRQPAEERRGLQARHQHARAHRRAGRQVVIQREVQIGVALLHHVDERTLGIQIQHRPRPQAAIRVQGPARIQHAAHVVPRARARLHQHLRLGGRALAHQVHRAARLPRAFEQALRAAEHLHPVQIRRATGEAIAHRIETARQRHAVVLDIRDLEPARIEIAPAVGHLADCHARGVLQDLADGRQVLVIQPLARHHRDRLRNVLQRLFGLADGRHAGPVRLRALGLRMIGARHQHRRQRAGGGRRLGFHTDTAVHIHRAIARARQQRAQTIRHAVLAIQARAARPAQLRRGIPQRNPRLPRKRGQRVIQRPRRNREGDGADKAAKAAANGSSTVKKGWGQARKQARAPDDGVAARRRWVFTKGILQ